jgi:hypothetical protein
MQRSAPTRIDCLMHASALASMRGDALDATLLELLLLPPLMDIAPDGLLPPSQVPRVPSSSAVVCTPASSVVCKGDLPASCPCPTLQNTLNTHALFSRAWATSARAETSFKDRRFCCPLREAAHNQLSRTNTR